MGGCTPGNDQEALWELLRVQNIYENDPKVVVPMDQTKLEVLSRSSERRALSALLPDDTKEKLADHECHMEYTEEEIDLRRETGQLEVVRPYWDVGLRCSRQKRLGLYRALLDANLGTLRTGVKARVGFFAVAKKNGSLRLIFDCRETNSLMKPPPGVSLGGPDAMSRLDLSREALTAGGSDPEQLDLHVADLDLQDGFYQVLCPEVASWFGTGDAMTASEWGVTEVYCEVLRRLVPVSGDTRLYFCMHVVCMGWSWGVYFCQRVVERGVELAWGRWRPTSSKPRTPEPRRAIRNPWQPPP